MNIQNIELEGFEVQELLDLSQAYSEEVEPPVQDKQKGSIVLQYLIETQFLQSLRNSYTFFNQFTT